MVFIRVLSPLTRNVSSIFSRHSANRCETLWVVSATSCFVQDASSNNRPPGPDPYLSILCEVCQVSAHVPHHDARTMIWWKWWKRGMTERATFELTGTGGEYTKLILSIPIFDWGVAKQVHPIHVWWLWASPGASQYYSCCYLVLPLKSQQLPGKQPAVKMRVPIIRKLFIQKSQHAPSGIFPNWVPNLFRHI